MPPHYHQQIYILVQLVLGTPIGLAVDGRNVGSSIKDFAVWAADGSAEGFSKGIIEGDNIGPLSLKAGTNPQRMGCKFLGRYPLVCAPPSLPLHPHCLCCPLLLCPPAPQPPFCLECLWLPPHHPCLLHPHPLFLPPCRDHCVTQIPITPLLLHCTLHPHCPCHNLVCLAGCRDNLHHVSWGWALSWENFSWHYRWGCWWHWQFGWVCQWSKWGEQMLQEQELCSCLCLLFFLLLCCPKSNTVILDEWYFI